MRMRGIIWGLLIILLGLLLLLDQLGFLPVHVNAWRVFFALLMIGFGIRWILPTTRISPKLKNLVSISCETATEVLVKFDYGAGELEVEAGEAASRFVEGSFSEGVEYTSKLVGTIQYIELKSPQSNWWDIPSWGVESRIWKVRLPPTIPLSLTFNTGANSSNMDLGNLMVKELQISTGASGSVILMPSQSIHTNAVIKAGAASVEVKIPDKVSARIHVSGGAASIEVDTQRFHRKGSGFESPDYDTSDNRVELRVEFGAGKLYVH